MRDNMSKASETQVNSEQNEPPPRKRERSEKNKIPDYEALFTGGGGKKSESGFMRRVFRKDWARIVYSSLIYLLQALPVWIMPLVTADVIDTVTVREAGYVRRIVIDAVIFGVMLLQNIPTTMWRLSIVNKMIRSTSAGLRGGVINKLQRLSITYHREMESGRLQSKLLRDIENVDNYYRNVLQVVVPGVLGAVVATAISLYRSPLVTLFFVGVVPLNVVNSLLYRKKMRRTNRNYRQENEKMSGKITEMLQMLPLTKAHGLEAVEENELNERIRGVTRAGLRLDRTNASFGAASWVISNLLAGLCLFFCVFLAIRGKITVGEVVLFQSLFASINGSVLTLVNVYPTLTTGLESVRSLGEIMRADDIERIGGKQPPAIDGRVDFCNVSYRYPDGDKCVVKNFSLSVRAGECIAFVGSSGSGKSTVINLLIGLLDPTEGCVKIDGVPLGEMDKRAYRHYLSVVPQNSILFNGTLRENITYGLPTYTPAELQKAIEDAAVTEFLPSFPDGLDSQVGEHGDKLSGGQRQRVCIARALLRHPKILILDEATSALDNISERHVQRAIEGMTKSGTTFIVAHRLSTIRNADRIVVMENGEAAEIGTYDELVAKNGKFAELEKLSRIKEE